jgi:2-polyprenyl-3-methyl-5-hydroxy-6-metoxy-1,4-benzoquinol methylase
MIEYTGLNDSSDFGFSNLVHPVLTTQFPAPPGCSEAAIWTGNGFLVDGNSTPILSYEVVGSFAWTDELTEVHEEEAGDDHYIDRASRRHAADQLARYVAPGGTIMDIGCSSGFFLSLLRQRFPDCLIMGADCVRGPLEQLSSVMPGIPLLQFNLAACPLPDRSFDGLALLNVLEHIEDDVAAVRHLQRILKPGGIAVIEVPAGPHLYDVYDRELLHFRRYRMADLLELLRAAGLEILERSHLGIFLYPAFQMVKKRNQKYLSASPEVRREVVKCSMRRANSNAAMHAILNLEAKLRRWIYYPAGIRCLVTCRKPE